MIFKVTAELFFDVQDEAEACDAVSEMLRGQLRAFAGSESCFIDWNHARQFGVPSPVQATPDEVLNMEYQSLKRRALHTGG